MKIREAGLTVGEVATACHLSESTLRMWERRYDFPAPLRTPGGCRRYARDEVERIREVLQLRATGLSLPAAIARVGAAARPNTVPIAGPLELDRPQGPFSISPSAFDRLLTALQDEILLRGDAHVVVAGARADVSSQAGFAHWRSLAGAARGSIAAHPEDTAGPDVFLLAELPALAVAVTGRHRPADDNGAERFEVCWTMRPEQVRPVLAAALAAAPAASAASPALAALVDRPVGDAHDTRAADALITRIARYLSEPAPAVEPAAAPVHASAPATPGDVRMVCAECGTHNLVERTLRMGGQCSNCGSYDLRSVDPPAGAASGPSSAA